MTLKIASYRKFIKLTQTDLANILGISLQAYWNKEKGNTPFTDTEKLIIKELFTPYFPDILLEDIFFSPEVSYMLNEKKASISKICN